MINYDRNRTKTFIKGTHYCHCYVSVVFISHFIYSFFVKIKNRFSHNYHFSPSTRHPNILIPSSQFSPTKVPRSYLASPPKQTVLHSFFISFSPKCGCLFKHIFTSKFDFWTRVLISVLITVKLWFNQTFIFILKFFTIIIVFLIF